MKWRAISTQSLPRQQGAEVVVEQNRRPVAVIRSPMSTGRLLSECIALAEARGSTATLDDRFMKDVEEESLGRSRPLLEPASLGIILDSGVVIEAERGHLDVARFLNRIEAKVGAMEAALCSITVAELAHGIHRADTAARRESRRAFLDDLKAAVPVYPITDDTAELVGKIGAESSAAGVTIPFDDPLIGACALERGYAIATRNRRHFQKIPGLKLIEL